MIVALNSQLAKLATGERPSPAPRAAPASCAATRPAYPLAYPRHTRTSR